MSDQTGMNSDFEFLVEGLKDIKLPEAKIDRDQLMYDAGWAAANAQRQSAANSTRKSRLPSLAMSFASGLAVATAVLFSVIPVTPESVSDDSTTVVVKNETANETQLASTSVTASGNESESVDLMDWIDSLPPGHSLASGFSSQPVSPEYATTKASLTRPANYRETTTHLLMQEFIPEKRHRKVVPQWTTWLLPGA